jgi:hypothetical protein
VINTRDEVRGLMQPIYLLLADQIDDYFDPAVERFQVLQLNDLGIADLPKFCFQYNRRELCAACKPFVLEHLLDNGFDSVIFIDPDVLVTDRFAQSDIITRHSIVLSPHLLSPPGGVDRIDRELKILQAGAYNGGFITISDTPSARRFLAWWKARLANHCEGAVEQGLHYDQRWLDLVPALFSDVYILRDAGANIGYWNLPERTSSLQTGTSSAGETPARFIHFSGFDPTCPHAVTRYAADLNMDNIGPAAEVFRMYTGLLFAAGHRDTSTWPYAYGEFDNGVPIPEIVRCIYRQHRNPTALFGDPFLADSPTSFFHWLNQPERVSGKIYISRLWRRIYDQRPDLRQAFPDLCGDNGQLFLNWIAERGKDEYEMADPFKPPFKGCSS